jgi:4-amino-4-deoxy-L-arabinose transferase-like glycosyltransferase
MVAQIRLSRFVTAILVLGIFIRVGCMLITKSYVNPDDWEYGHIARNIAAGNGFARITEPGGSPKLTSSHAPLYPYFLSIFYGISQKPHIFIIIQLIQIFLAAFTILIMYKTARLLFGEKIAFLTALGVAIYPPFIYYSIKITPATFTLFLTSLTILLFLKIKKGNPGLAILGGVVLGLSILNEPVTLIIYPVVVIWYFIKNNSIKNFLILIITSILILVPYTVRNYSIHHGFVPITTQFGINFWIGNNPRATGTDYYKVYSIKQGNSVLMTQTLPRKTRLDLNKKAEIERSEFFLKQGIAFVKQNPGQFIKLTLKKFYYYWWFTPKHINGSFDAHKYRTVYTIIYLPVLILGILGMALSIAKKYIKNSLFIVLILLFISSTYIITHVGLMRYRVTVEIYLIMFSSMAIVNLVSRIYKSSREHQS